VDTSLRESAGATFCSHCGRPPRGKWAEREHRVCRRCGFGIVLHTDADLLGLDLATQPFLIVDHRFTVQAISLLAEAALALTEADSVGSQLDELLVTEEPRQDLGLKLFLAHEGIRERRSARSFALRAPSEAEPRFTGRVHTCGPPTAALLVLEQASEASTDAPISVRRIKGGTYPGQAAVSV
jgi:hypothetical protein